MSRTSRLTDSKPREGTNLRSKIQIYQKHSHSVDKESYQQQQAIHNDDHKTVKKIQIIWHIGYISYSEEIIFKKNFHSKFNFKLLTIPANLSN